MEVMQLINQPMMIMITRRKRNSSNTIKQQRRSGFGGMQLKIEMNLNIE